MTKTMRFLSLAGALLAAGCSDDDGGTDPNPSIAATLGGAITVVQGQTGTTQVTVTRAGGFTGAVTLTASNLPTGVTAAFDPATIPAGSGTGTSTLTLTAATTAATGTANFTVTASGGGSVTSTATGSVTVNAAPDFTLAVAPTTLSVEQGDDGTANITITRTGGFAGAVNLSVANLPTGVTATFDNAAPTGNTAVLTLTAEAGAALATTNLTINGQGSPGTRSAALALTVTAAPAADFTLAVDPTTLSVQQGANGTANITITRTGGFTGAVNLSVPNLPTGVTATFDNAAPTGTTAVLTLAVGAGAAAATTNLTINGEGTPGTRTAALALTVTAPAGDFTLTVDPTTLNVQQGGTGTANITITRTGGFTGAVNLSVANLPNGVTAAFDNAAPTGNAAVLTLSAAAGATIASTNLTINGQGTPGTRSATLGLNVTAPPGPGNSNIKFCDLDNLPIWFAFKDGNGAWTQVPGVVAGDGTTYSFNITQSTGAYAWVTGTAGSGFTTAVTYGTQAQLTGNTGQCPTAPFTRTLNGSVSNIGATDQVVIAMGGSAANASTAQLNFQLLNVLDGPADLIAVRNTVGAGLPPSITPAGIIIRRALNIAHNGTIPVLDFGAAEAFAPITASATINGAGADNLIATMSYITPTTQAGLTTALLPTSPVTVHGVPADKQEANDLHQLSAIAAANNGDARGHFMWFKALADKTIDLGVGLTAPTNSNLGNAPYPRLQSTGPIQAIYDDFFSFTSNQLGGAAADNRIWTITVLKGFFTGANYTMAIEDLTGAGYQTAWALKVGVLTDLQTIATGFSNNGSTTPIVEGGFSDFASKVGQITP